MIVEIYMNFDCAIVGTIDAPLNAMQSDILSRLLPILFIFLFLYYFVYVLPSVSLTVHH